MLFGRVQTVSSSTRTSASTATSACQSVRSMRSFPRQSLAPEFVAIPRESLTTSQAKPGDHGNPADGWTPIIIAGDPDRKQALAPQRTRETQLVKSTKLNAVSLRSAWTSRACVKWKEGSELPLDTAMLRKMVTRRVKQAKGGGAGSSRSVPGQTETDDRRGMAAAVRARADRRAT